MSHACSHADLSLLHIGVFITMLVVLSQLVLTWFFASFLMQLFDVFIIIVVWVLLFQICNVSSFLLEFWSIVLLNCILNCWSTVQLAHCFFLLLSLDGGVRCFWWWRDNNATLHFSYLICFLIHDNRVFVMIRTRSAIFSRRMCRNFCLHASTALWRQLANIWFSGEKYLFNFFNFCKEGISRNGSQMSIWKKLSTRKF